MGEISGYGLRERMVKEAESSENGAEVNGSGDMNATENGTLDLKKLDRKYNIESYGTRKM
jgi:hypothetical protein